MPDRLETRPALNVKNRKDIQKHGINNKTSKGKLLKVYFYLFYSLHKIDLHLNYRYCQQVCIRKECVQADLYFTADFYKNIESSILTKSIMRKQWFSILPGKIMLQ